MGGVCKDLNEMQRETSPTFSSVGTERGPLAVSPMGRYCSCTGGFREVSQDREASLGTRVATRVVVSIELSVREKTNCVNHET